MNNSRIKIRNSEEQRRDLEQSDLEHRPYRFWDDMWNEESHSYEDNSEPD